MIEELKSLGCVVDETATGAVLMNALKEARKSALNSPSTNSANSTVPVYSTDVPVPPPNTASTSSVPHKKEETVQISKKEWEDVQKQLKMLYEVADKGRVHNYESQNTERKPFRVKLSVYDNKLITGWQVKRDELIKDNRTGTTIGERQEIEVKLLDAEGNASTVTFDGYASFSNARYGKRIEAEVVNRKEDYQGNASFDVKLPAGKIISMDARFVN